MSIGRSELQDNARKAFGEAGLVPDLLGDQRAAERRIIADLAILRIRLGLGGAHHAVAVQQFVGHAAFLQRKWRRAQMGQSLALSVTLPDALEPVLVTGKVAWVSPLGAQSSNPAGIGVAFIDDKHNLSSRIEKLLGGMLHSNEPTYTM
mgnify:CR=1 FL=1